MLETSHENELKARALLRFILLYVVKSMEVCTRQMALVLGGFSIAMYGFCGLPSLAPRKLETFRLNHCYGQDLLRAGPSHWGSGHSGRRGCSGQCFRTGGKI